jgi:integrase
MAAEKLLSEARCKAAKPADKVYYLNDGSGLRLRVRPDGSKTWLLRYFLNTKEGTHGIGPYPQTTLQVARAKAELARIQVKEGVNPSTAQRVARAAQIIKNQVTFGAVAKGWLDHNRNAWSEHHTERNQGLLRRYLLPDLSRLPVDSIEEHFLFSILKRAYDSGAKESSRRARAVAAQVFSYARATHCGTRNPARDMSDNSYFKKPQVKHFVALSQSDVGTLVTMLNKVGPDQILAPQTVCALKLALFTGLRDNSIRGAKWGEIDLENAFWTVPASRMKSRREHVVPLPRQAIEAFKALAPLTLRTKDSFVFPGKGKLGHMAENTLRLALHRLGFKVTAHGMRSLITDVLSERKFPADAIERQLDHQEQKQVRKAYLRSDFMLERISMMQWFADWCDSQASGKATTNVLTLRRTA